MTWEALMNPIDDGESAVHFQIHQSGAPLSWSDVLAFWSASNDFVHFFCGLLTDSWFEAFRWETPPLQASGLSQPFEFVLVSDPQLQRQPDSADFDEHFVDAGAVVSFENLGGDARLVVPAPIHGSGDDYAHLASFLRSAPAEQIQELWQCVATVVTECIGDRPLWLSTAGTGVPWVHVRVDDQPKYYSYDPYRTVRI